MLTNRILISSFLSLAVAAAALPARAVVDGQIDDFEDGTTQGWHGGIPHPVPPSNQPGGPAGDGDDYMLLTAIGGGGPGSRLVAINESQWAGDYLAAGVERIEMDLANFEQVDLSIRLLLEDPVAGPPLNVAITQAVLLPAGSGWTHAVFSVRAADLVVLQGDASTLLANTTVLRIAHNPDPTWPPPAIVAQLGVDNIEAAGAPIPVESEAWGRLKDLYR